MNMRYVRMQYDAYSQQFSFNDAEGASNLEDGALYLIADSSLDDFLQFEEPEAGPEPRIH